MKKTIFALTVALAATTFAYSQNGNVGIGTNSPTTKLDVNGSFRTRPLSPQTNGNSGNIPLTTSAFFVADGNYISPLNLPANPQPGQRMVIYSQASYNATINTANTSLTTPITMQRGEMYEFVGDGTRWTITPLANKAPGDATRFLGGTIGAKFNQPNGSVSGSANALAVSPIGGVDATVGAGYTVSNPSNGIFVITFAVPFTKIYGTSTNIVDSYGGGSGNVAVGTTPDFNTPGTRLLTNDNTQISFLNNSTIRVKTGDSNGNLTNRSFTFLVIGQ